LTKESFRAVYDRYPPSDFFATQFSELTGYSREDLWREIYADFASDISAGLSRIAGYGCRVIRDFTLRHLQEICGFKVFILFSHYNKMLNKLELSDGLYSKGDFAAAIPTYYTGIFDLTVCNSSLIRTEIKNTFPDNQVLSFGVEIEIIPGMLIHDQLIQNLLKTEINYLDSFMNTLEDLNIP